MSTKTKRVPLAEPIDYGTDAEGKPAKLKEIMLRKPMAGDLRGVKLLQIHEMDTAALEVLIPRIASPALTAAHVRTLDPADVITVFGILGDFFTPSPVRPESPTTP